MFQTMNHLVVITLEDATERHKRISEWFEGISFDFFKVKRMKDPEMGCFTSHQKVLKMAKDNNWKYVTIFEDDAFPKYKWDEIEEIVNEAFKELPDDWQALQLGYFPFELEKYSKHLNKIKCSLDCHAYILNVDRVQTLPWKKRPIDNIYFCGQLLYGRENALDKSFAIKPNLFSQKAFNSSSIRNIHTLQENIIELFGGEDNMAEISTKINIIALIVLASISILIFAIGFAILLVKICKRKFN